MATRVYIVPSIGAGTSPADAFRPAYIEAAGGQLRAAMPFGREPVFLALADVTPAQHALIAANVPITVVPQDLSSVVGAATAVVEAELDSWNIPGQWVTAGLTYRQVLFGVAAIFQFAQRFNGLHRLRLFVGGVGLNATVGSLTQEQRDRLAAVSDSFGWDRSGVTASTTIRQLLRGAAQQWVGNIRIGTEVL
jgi:hypothetical protein